MTHTKVHELEAFCVTCPSAEEVTHLLQAGGFTLAFQMDAVPSACAGAPPLPAQYTTRIKNAGEVSFWLALMRILTEDSSPSIHPASGTNPAPERDPSCRAAPTRAPRWLFPFTL